MVAYPLTLCSFPLQLQGDLHFLKEDIETVERQCWELARAKEKYLLENRTSRDLTSSSWDLSASVGHDSTQNRGAGSMPGSSQSGISPKHAVGNCEGQSLLRNPTKNEICPVTGSLDHRVSDAQELPDRLAVGKKIQVLAQVPFTHNLGLLGCCIKHDFFKLTKYFTCRGFFPESRNQPIQFLMSK